MLLTILPSTCLGVFQKEIYWSINGPGGDYGVFSYDKKYIDMGHSYILLGPVQIYVPLGFEATRVLFVCGLLFPIGVILIIRQKKTL